MGQKCSKLVSSDSEQSRQADGNGGAYYDWFRQNCQEKWRVGIDQQWDSKDY